jgi:hypothetical protein
MAEDLIHCPSCNFRLRLPPDLYGHEVECPQCHTRFNAPVPQAAPLLRSPPGREYDAGSAAGVDAAPAPQAPGGGYTAAAICLLVTALLGALSNGWTAVSFVAARANPAEFDREFDRQMNQQHKDMSPEQREQIKQIMTTAKDYGPGAFAGLAALNLLSALGAIMMLMRRGYWLAVLGCLAALNPVNFGCCLLGQVPFAIWGLVVLLGSGKRAFR